MQLLSHLNAYVFFIFIMSLTACQQATQVKQNADSSTGASSQYNGPAAKDSDVRAFQTNLWDNLIANNRCGQCHGSGGQEPRFADNTDVNLAYNQVLPYVVLSNPSTSKLVSKVGTGHNCWETVNSVCADSIENMISAWGGGGSSNNSREIVLTAPVIKDPGQSKNLPANATDNDPNSFEKTLYPLLTSYCSNCHYEQGSISQQSPFFANPNDVNSSYLAAKSKINIDSPESSRFVLKVQSGHNCWDNCSANAAELQTAITNMSDAITPDTVDPNLVISKALKITDGIIASGGSRFEANLIALWEFKAGTGTTAFDTSGVEPAINLTLSGKVAWLGSYGLDFTGGKAQASTLTSKKLTDLLVTSGEYSLETWVIPGNVAQEDVNIISYDAGSNAKNFALTQNAYSYVMHNRSNQSDTNGEPFLSTEDAGELLQATLQHVVVNYDPINGRQIYLNGQLVNVTDPITQSTTISSWDNTFALVFGNSSANSKAWTGQIRMVAMHDKILSASQIQQNFDAGVGQKYFLLFSVSEHTGIADSYIMFQVSQFDSYSYLFEKPTFIVLDDTWTVSSFTIKNMRIGINGREASVGQFFANLSSTIDSAHYIPGKGQELSPNGTIIALEKGIGDDEFFISFEQIASDSHTWQEDPIAPITPPGADVESSDSGIKTFEEVYASILQMTDIDSSNAPQDIVTLNNLYTEYKQQLPAVPDVDTFLSSHQMAIAQLALAACSARVDLDAAQPIGSTNRRIYSQFDFSQSAQTAFDSETKKGYAIDPISNRVLLNGLTSQPDETDVYNSLSSGSKQTLSSSAGNYQYDSLISKMSSCLSNPTPCNTTERTAQIVKSLCAAIVGSAATLIQ